MIYMTADSFEMSWDRSKSTTQTFSKTKIIRKSDVNPKRLLIVGEREERLAILPKGYNDQIVR